MNFMAIPRVKMMSIQLTLAAKTEVGRHTSDIGSHWEENLCIVLERTTLFIGVFYCSFFFLILFTCAYTAAGGGE